MAKTTFGTIDDYIAVQPEKAQPVLRRLRAILRKALPNAEEAISYSIPALKIDKRVVLFFAAWKEHYSLYPSSRRLEAAFKKELAPYDANGKGTIRFPLAAPIPATLIADIAKFRAREAAAHVAKRAAAREKASVRRKAKSSVGTLLRVVIVGVLIGCATSAPAQERPGPAVEFAVGQLAFPDETVVTEGMVGGAARFYLMPRLSVGPEVAFIQGDEHSHLMLTGNLTFDLMDRVNGSPRVLTPFVVAGGGLFRTEQSFPFDNFSSSEGAFTGGGGVRVKVGDRVYAGAEVRVGWETHIRYNGMLGVHLGR